MLFNIYVKELRDCFRDRRTFLLTVVLPIVLMTVLVFVYEKIVSQGQGEIYTIAVTETFSEEEEKIFADYKQFEFKQVSDPKNAVADGNAIVGLKFSTDFNESIKNKDLSAKVSIIGDPYNENGSNVIALIEKALSDYEKFVTSERLIERDIDVSILKPFVIEYEETIDGNLSLMLIAFFIPLILTVAVSASASPVAIDLFAGEKERKTMEALLMTPVKRSTLLLAKWLTISTIAVITGIVTLMVVFLEIILFTTNIKAAISFGENIYIVILAVFMVIILYATLCSSLLMLTSIIAKTIKEAQTYSTPISLLMLIPSLFMASIGIHEFKILHFAIPVLNIFAIFKELLFGIIQYNHIFVTILSNLALTLTIFIVCRILYMKDRWVLNS
ncbi:ABC transporter permease [Lysinibacillus sp. NPDC094403]|uniref:ABC transporter permease n=1 Tax=Lysinibacillus sp. NPDC094403 TaxID=3390581 RepID=UPI003D0867EB